MLPKNIFLFDTNRVTLTPFFVLGLTVRILRDHSVIVRILHSDVEETNVSSFVDVHVVIVRIFLVIAHMFIVQRSPAHWTPRECLLTFTAPSIFLAHCASIQRVASFVADTTIHLKVRKKFGKMTTRNAQHRFGF